MADEGDQGVRPVLGRDNWLETVRDIAAGLRRANRDRRRQDPGQRGRRKLAEVVREINAAGGRDAVQAMPRRPAHGPDEPGGHD